MPTDRRFTGQRQEDSSLGSLYDFNARFYSPALGRFLSADTLVPSASDPQQLNRYSYALNSPLNYTDPSGHAADAGGASCPGCWQELWEAYNRVADAASYDSYHGHLKEYLSAKAVLYYNLTSGDAPENIEAAAGYVDSTFSRLKVNGYAGQATAVSAAWDLGAPGAAFSFSLVGGTAPNMGENVPAGERLEYTAQSPLDAMKSSNAIKSSILPLKSGALRDQVEAVIKSMDLPGRKPPAGVYQGGAKVNGVKVPGLYKGGGLPPQPQGYYTESDIWPSQELDKEQKMITWLDIPKEIPGARGQILHTVNSEVESLVNVLSRLDFKTYVIDGSKVIDEKSFFAEMARVLEFPEYFGYGWASWDDCLGDFGSLAPYRVAIIWKHADQTFLADPQTFLQAVCDLYGLAMHISVYPTRYPQEGIEAKQLGLFF